MNDALSGTGTILIGLKAIVLDFIGCVFTKVCRCSRSNSIKHVTKLLTTIRRGKTKPTNNDNA